MMNKVILMGRLGSIPEIKAVTSGKTVCKMRVTTSEYVNKEERVDWHNVVVLGKAEVK